jgi:hypothetical protein
VFAVRIWNGKSPFEADRTHIHHLLTNQGFSHGFAAKLICFLHGFVLIEVYWLRWLKPEFTLAILIAFMLAFTLLLKKMGVMFKMGRTGSWLADAGNKMVQE